MADTADTPAPSYGAALQLQVRRARAFSDVEQSLPAVSQHRSFFADAFSSPLDEAKARTMAGTLRRAAAELLSHLGPWNPKPLPVEDGSVVWLLDNTAFRAGSGDGTWKAEFVTAVFAPRRSLGVADAATNIARRLGIEDGAAEIEIIHQRLLPFVLAIQPGRLVEIEFAGRADVALGPCGRNGISSDVKMVPEAGTGRVVESVAKGLPADVTGLLRMKTAFAEEKGWAVISDIDDTIKITQTSDPIGILASTFVDEPTPVAGMPELYGHMHKLLTAAAPFFYLSASPYNLYSFLRSFRDAHYPYGQLVLRDASWQSIPGLLSNLTLGTQEYKVSRMRKMHDWLPGRSMICIGDSTQTDPESYGEIYRSYPAWVHLILIRKVTNVAEVGLDDKNAPERFEKAFDGVPRSVWHIFEDPKECIGILDRLVGSAKTTA